MVTKIGVLNIFGALAARKSGSFAGVLPEFCKMTTGYDDLKVWLTSRWVVAAGFMAAALLSILPLIYAAYSLPIFGNRLSDLWLLTRCS